MDSTEQPLWSDRRIEDFANAKYDASEYFEVVGAMQTIRNDYEQQLATLATWERVPDGEVDGYNMRIEHQSNGETRIYLGQAFITIRQAWSYAELRRRTSAPPRHVPTLVL